MKPLDIILSENYDRSNDYRQKDGKEGSKGSYTSNDVFIVYMLGGDDGVANDSVELVTGIINFG